MSMSIITSIAKSDTTKTLKDVRRLKTSLDRERITEKQGFGAFEFVVISDYDKEEFDSVWGNAGNYRFVPVEQEEMHDPSFMQRHVFNNLWSGTGDRMVYMDPKVHVQGLTAILMYKSPPDRGDSGHCDLPMSQEIKDKLNNEGASGIVAVKNWANLGDTDYFPFFYMFSYGNLKHESLQLKDIEEQKKYPTFWHWVESRDDCVIVDQDIGVAGPYFVNNEEENMKLNQAWEDNVASLYNADASLYTRAELGGEADALYLSYGHDYRTLQKQVSILYFVGDEDPSSDRYAELWLTGVE